MKKSRDTTMKAPGHIRTRHLRKHRAHCYAVALVARGDWSHPWSDAPRDDVVWRDARGRRNNGHTVWLVFPCNDTDCRANLMVCAEDILTQIQKKEKNDG